MRTSKDDEPGRAFRRSQSAYLYLLISYFYRGFHIGVVQAFRPAVSGGPKGLHYNKMKKALTFSYGTLAQWSNQLGGSV